jgi:hypothetical protein
LRVSSRFRRADDKPSEASVARLRLSQIEIVGRVVLDRALPSRLPVTCFNAEAQEESVRPIAAKPRAAAIGEEIVEPRASWFRGSAARTTSPPFLPSCSSPFLCRSNGRIRDDELEKNVCAYSTALLC